MKTKIADNSSIYRNKLVAALVTASINMEVLGRGTSNHSLRQFCFWAYLVKYDGFTDTQDFFKYWAASSTGKPYSDKKQYHIGGFMRIYHWTNLKY